MKRSELKRRTPLQATGPARATVRLRKCPVKKGGCGAMFPVLKDKQACCLECAAAVGAWMRAEQSKKEARKAAKAAADDRKQTRAQLEALKTLKELRAEAQAEFNRWTRHRDRLAGHGCICCGEPLDWNSNKPGGAVDAGHFVSRGSCPELAFVEANVNAQRKGCNRPGGTTRAQFTAGMIARHGSAVVEWLEGPHELPHYKHDDYRRIRADYRARANALEREIK